jgi:hypothetical protein
VLRARPGTVERFSDFPLLMYAERNVSSGEGPAPYQWQYTVIFSNEDGGTPPDRLMATWGRTTDIEFVYGITSSGHRGVIQAAGHRWVDFAGTRFRGHPELWVATENNMVADHGGADAIRFAPLPVSASLDHVSREQVMDDHPWTYRITSEEMFREWRVDDQAQAGSGRMPDPRRYIVVEACADVADAALTLEVGVRAGSGVVWRSTDRGAPAFRIARSGCFRAGVPLPAGTGLDAVTGIRARAFARTDGTPASDGAIAPGVTLRRLNQMLALDQDLRIAHRAIGWSGMVFVPSNGEPVDVGWASH